MPARRPRPPIRGTVGLDFDGVLHLYSRGWTGVTPAEGAVPGAQAAVRNLLERGAKVVVISSRADTKEGCRAIRDWLRRHGFPDLPVTFEKVPALAYVDDRAVPFDPAVGFDREVLDRIDRLAGPWRESLPDVPASRVPSDDGTGEA